MTKGKKSTPEELDEKWRALYRAAGVTREPETEK